MKGFRKILTLLLVAILFVSSFTSTSNAMVNIHQRCGGFVYCWAGDGVEVTKYKGKKTKMTIPVTLHKEKVSKISSLGNVKQIHIPKNFQGELLLNYSPKLKKVTITENNSRYIVRNNLLLNTDNEEFYFDEKETLLVSAPGGIKNPKIPDSVQQIGMNAFEASNIVTLNLGENVSVLQNSSFARAKKLKAINFNDKLKIIDANVFWGCDSLKNVKLPEGLETIGYQSFYFCQNLQKVTVPSTVKKIEKAAFGDCKKLKFIYIYSRDCKFENAQVSGVDTRIIPKKTTIYGYKDSTAHKYAKRYGNRFVELKE